MPTSELAENRPKYSSGDLSKILVTEVEIQKRVREIAEELNLHYRNKDVTVVCVLSGALTFTADLLRHLRFPTRLDCVRAESYGNATEASQPAKITNPLKTDIANHHVLIVDDILDSGRSLQALTAYLEQAKPESLASCMLLDKPDRRKVDVRADFSGFSIPDEFVVGYGLDFAERYRNLPCIGVLKPEFQDTKQH